MPGLKDDDLPKCGVVGVHPSILGIITSVQTAEAVRLLTGREPNLLNKIFYVDLREMTFETLQLSAEDSCRICGIDAEARDEPVADTFVEETCARDGQRNFVISPKVGIDIDLEKLRGALDKRGYPVKMSGRLGITFEQSKDIHISILKSGVMILQTALQLEDYSKEDVLNIYKSLLVHDLGLSLSILPK